MRLFYAITLFVSCFLSINVLSENARFVTEIYPPFQIQNDDHSLSGFSIDIIEALKVRSDISGKIEILPWARAYKIASKETDVFIFTISRTPDREHLFQWVGDFYLVSDAFFALKSRSDIMLTDLNDARRYQISVPIDDAAADRLQKFGFGENNLVYVNDQEQSIRMLHAGRVDLNLNNERGFYTRAIQLGYSPDEFSEVLVLSKTSLSLAASLNTSPELVNKMRLAFQELKRDGSYAKLVDKWFPPIQ